MRDGARDEEQHASPRSGRAGLLAVAAFGVGLALAAAEARAEVVLRHEGGVFEFVFGDGWETDRSDPAHLAIACPESLCGPDAVMCDANTEPTDGTLDEYLAISTDGMDADYLDAISSVGEARVTVPFARRDLGQKQGFFAEYAVKTSVGPLKIQLFQGFNKGSVVTLRCSAPPSRTAMIETILRDFRLPS